MVAIKESQGEYLVYRSSNQTNAIYRDSKPKSFFTVEKFKNNDGYVLSFDDEIAHIQLLENNKIFVIWYTRTFLPGSIICDYTPETRKFFESF